MPFEKWQYGPVVPSIYFSYNRFRDRNIELEGVYSIDYSVWDNLIGKLLKIGVFLLVKIPCNMSAYKRYEDDIFSKRYVKPYTLEEIFEDFRDVD